MYAKIENGMLKYAPKTILVDGVQVTNPTNEMLIDVGYLPVRLTESPEPREGVTFTAGWEQTAEEIVQAWEAKAGVEPISPDEVLRIDMRQRVNSLTIDNQTAGRMIDYFPTRKEFCAEGALIPAKTRVRDDNDPSVIWRNSVDVWNTDENSPENAPTIWDKIAYRNGIRIIPDVIPATLAWMNGELGWRDGHVYKSGMDGNVYLPGTQGAPWELML